MTENAHDWDAAYGGDQSPPWDIGRPQPQFEALAGTGALRGRVLDCGCGTGEHTLLAAGEGAEAVGIDLSARAIRRAQAKAEGRGLTARFEVADALTLRPEDLFDVVLDCGVFHVFDDCDRSSYVSSLHNLVRPGGTVYLMCFSDREPGEWGPRRVSESELREAFAAGWQVELTRTEMSVNPVNGQSGVQAWFATIRRDVDG
ncbi:MAG TPA: class I SAM-dependent methyltransferase [Mycobacteriales bacterium]|jgi:SAM-dependent methyltransferase|nr:class I SAM-dependent methyltransferase [Mycobacteriales bacterium]